MTAGTYLGHWRNVGWHKAKASYMVTYAELQRPSLFPNQVYFNLMQETPKGCQGKPP